jgi:hypothetical protein
MTYTSSISDNQLNSSRHNKKSSPLDGLPIASPKPVSRAAAIARMRRRHSAYLDIIALFNLIDFHLQCKRVLADLSNKPLENGYVRGVIHGRTVLAEPCTFYFESTRVSLWRLEVLQEYHQSNLTRQAAIVIKQTIEQHRATLSDMWEAREGLAALSIH